MASERFEMRVPVSLLERVDAVRGLESRASFFRRAAVEKLGAPSREPRPVEIVAADDPRREGYGLSSGPPLLVERLDAGGCPECGGQWTRRPDVAGRFCVDCGGREAK